MKKILLLGGSAQQLPAIESAKRLGYYTILCDFLHNNPGQSLADKFYCISTTDVEAILAVAINERIDGIIAYASDPAAYTAAYVAEKMNLPTNPLSSIEILTNKDKFKNFLFENDFSTPLAKGFSSLEQARIEFDNFKLPVIIKPVDSSGSKGVDKISNIGELDEKFAAAIKFSKTKKIIIEEFIEMKGYQVAGDGFVINGKLVFRCFGNDHFNKLGLNPFVPIAASFPSVLHEQLQKKIHQEIQRVIDLLELRNGAYNFDICIDEFENVFLMEIGPRNGGNYIPQVINYATDVNLVDFTIKTAMGERLDELKLNKPKGFWSYYSINSQKAGIFKKIKIKKNVLNDNIVESYINYIEGDKIAPFLGANNSIGILIMKFSSLEEMLDMMDNSEKWIDIELI